MATRGAILGLLLAFTLAGAARAGELVVIVHPKRQVQLTASEVAQIFLRKRRFWDDGKAIVPVNRESGSEVRKAFGRLLFGEDTRALVVYWNRQYFRGVLPPATLASGEAVKRFVAAERRAIGYIRPDLLDDSVHVVLRVVNDADPAD
jgi:ABC-type phosphate transport system substrate-binding protein